MICFIAWSIGIVMGAPIGGAYIYNKYFHLPVLPTLPRASARDFRRRERANKRALRREIQRMRTVQ